MTFSFTKLATTALTGLAALGFASASYATPQRTVPQEGSIDAHVALVEAIEAQGVDFVVNHEYCERTPSVMGFYSSQAVCWLFAMTSTSRVRTKILSGLPMIWIRCAMRPST